MTRPFWLGKLINLHSRNTSRRFKLTTAQPKCALGLMIHYDNDASFLEKRMVEERKH